MKIFDDHISFAYTHVFSAHAESCPTSAVGEPLGVYNNHRQCLDSMNKEEHVALLKGTVTEERDSYIHLYLQATLVVFL